MSDDRNQVNANARRIWELEQRFDVLISNFKNLLYELEKLDDDDEER